MAQNEEKDLKAVSIILPGAELDLYDNFFDNVLSQKLFNKLKENIEWRQDKIKFFGKIHNLPRLTAWYADEGVEYQYSGIKMIPIMWNETLLVIKEQISKVSGFEFNSVLLNLYRNGNDSMGWHTDNEKSLGINPVIASLSFGAERVFRLRHNKDKNLKHEVLLKNGSLLIMKGSTQHHWEHHIPKSSKISTERINLTFRKIL